MEMIPIQIKSRQPAGGGDIIGRVDLPSFCIDHMRMTRPSANAQTMRNHIEKKCGGIKYSKMYIEGRDVSDAITADDLKNGAVIEVD